MLLITCPTTRTHGLVADAVRRRRSPDGARRTHIGMTRRVHVHRTGNVDRTGAPLGAAARRGARTHARA